MQFKDNKDTELPILPGDENKLDVEINYVVFGPKNKIKHKNLSKTLKRNFSKKITFKTLLKTNVFTVDKLVN